MDNDPEDFVEAMAIIGEEIAGPKGAVAGVLIGGYIVLEQRDKY